MARQFAGRLALIAFATASIRGLIAGTDFAGALQSALVAMGVFYVVGLTLGDLARRVVEENAQGEFKRLMAAEAESRS